MEYIAYLVYLACVIIIDSVLYAYKIIGLNGIAISLVGLFWIITFRGRGHTIKHQVVLGITALITPIIFVLLFAVTYGLLDNLKYSNPLTMTLHILLILALGAILGATTYGLYVWTTPSVEKEHFQSLSMTQ